MTKVAIARCITTLTLNNVTLGIYTNNLAAFQALKEHLPQALTFKLMSYSTVNRAVQNEGDSIDINTPLGIFVIAKRPLFRCHKLKKFREIAQG